MQCFQYVYARYETQNEWVELRHRVSEAVSTFNQKRRSRLNSKLTVQGFLIKFFGHYLSFHLDELLETSKRRSNEALARAFLEALAECSEAGPGDDLTEAIEMLFEPEDSADSRSCNQLSMDNSVRREEELSR